MQANRHCLLSDFHLGQQLDFYDFITIAVKQLAAVASALLFFQPGRALKVSQITWQGVLLNQS
jgi:hypothetical protein